MTTLRKAILGTIIFLTLGLFWSSTVLDKYKEEARAKNAMKHAYMVHQALFAYAQTHDQTFPTGEKNSNEALRKLFPEGLTPAPEESWFFQPGSPWHGNLKAPDGIVGTKETGFAKALSRNENHFSYCSGYSTDRDDSTLPLIYDEKYPGADTDQGKSKSGVVVRLGGNAKVIDLTSDKDSSVIREQIEKSSNGKALRPDG